jgi:Tyrosine phosphatase family
MLCQSILGQSDDDIIEEYFISDVNMRDHSVAALKAVKGKFDKRKFTGAPREAMVETLSFLKLKYGSVCPGYLNAIGFDKHWRDRFLACVPLENAATESKL